MEAKVAQLVLQVNRWGIWRHVFALLAIPVVAENISRLVLVRGMQTEFALPAQHAPRENRRPAAVAEPPTRLVKPAQLAVLGNIVPACAVERKMWFALSAQYALRGNRRLAAAAKPTTQLVKPAPLAVRDNIVLAAVTAYKIRFVQPILQTQCIAHQENR